MLVITKNINYLHFRETNQLILFPLPLVIRAGLQRIEAFLPGFSIPLFWNFIKDFRPFNIISLEKKISLTEIVYKKITIL